MGAMPTPRPVAGSVEELLDGARRLGEHRPVEARSTAGFERVEVDGERCVVKYVHPDRDYVMRASGDIGCRPRRVWALGLVDAAPDLIDHATLGAAPWGRNGWGVALLMRDVEAELVPPGDDPITEADHHRIVEACTGLAARMWGWRDDVGLLPTRCAGGGSATPPSFRATLEAHGVDTDGWWGRQVDLCLLGAVAQFGWEKALGDDDELAWWVDAARAGLVRL